MKPLYEIEQEILECVDMETGEIIDEERLEQLEMEREKKIEAVILWRKDLLAEVEAVRGEAKKLYDRAKVSENKAEQLKKYIEDALGGEKFKTERCSVSYRKSSKIIIDNPNDVPFMYLKKVKEDWFSKTAIKEAIESGKDVKGTHKEEGLSMVIK